MLLTMDISEMYLANLSYTDPGRKICIARLAQK